MQNQARLQRDVTLRSGTTGGTSTDGKGQAILGQNQALSFSNMNVYSGGQQSNEDTLNRNINRNRGS